MPRLARVAQSPSIRASTTRWISEVPEYIVLATASRRSRSIQPGRNRQALDPELGTLAPRLPRELTGSLALHQILVELPPGEGGRRFRQLALLGTQCEVHAVPLPPRVASRPVVADTRNGPPSRDMAAVAAPTCQPSAGQARRQGPSVASRRTTSIAPESR